MTPLTSDSFTSSRRDGSKPYTITSRSPRNGLCSRCVKDGRAQQLQDWTALLRTGEKLILDVPHPERRVGATFVGNGIVDPRIDIFRVLEEHARGLHFTCSS